MRLKNVVDHRVVLLGITRPMDVRAAFGRILLELLSRFLVTEINSSWPNR